jgi:glycosyltransferase involved in cell wall biosynthesis
MSAGPFDFDSAPLVPTESHFDYAFGREVPEPRVSVVTLLGEHDLRLRETGASLVRQSLQPWEWLVVSPEPLQPSDVVPSDDGRVKLVTCTRDESPAATANRALRETSADHVVRLEPGDLLEPTTLEKWLWFLESHPDRAFVDSQVRDSQNGGRVHRAGLASAGFDALARSAPGIALVRKTVFDAAGGYGDGLRGADANWDLWARCAQLRHWGGTLPEVLVSTPSFAAGQGSAIRPEDVPQLPGYHHSANAWLVHDVPCANTLRKEKQRLLLIVPWMAVGGADQFNLALLDQLIARGWDVSVVATLGGPNPLLPHFLQRTADVFVLGSFLRLVDYPRFLSYLTRSRRVDVVLVSNSELGYRLLPYLRSCCPETTLVDYCHSEIESWNSGGYPRFSVEYQGSLDLTVVASMHLRAWMSRRGADAERIEVCHVNVDAERFRADPDVRSRVRDSLGIGSEEPVILVAARLAEEKQPDVLVKALQLLRDDGLRFTALIAGDGPKAAWIQGFVNANKLKGVVRLLGSTSHEQIVELLAASDVFFLPSRWEGIALALYEAMAAGVPVVAADVGGQAELVTHGCGILVPRAFPEDEARLYANALADVLLDRPRREAMGRAARERVRTGFRLDDMGDRMHALLNEAIRRHEEDPKSVHPAIGRAAATEAVEQTRLADLAAQQYAVLSLRRATIRWGIVSVVDLLLGPTYRWLLRRGLVWLEPLKDRVVAALLRTNAA